MIFGIRIITHDVDRLVDFYEVVTNTKAERPTPFFAEFRFETGLLAIASTATAAMLGDDAPQPESTNAMFIEFLVEDADVEFARLRDHIDDIVAPPATMPWGNRSIVFRDPDHNLINVFSRPAG